MKMAAGKEAEKGFARYVWLVMAILALVMIGFALLWLSEVDYVVDYLLKMSGSDLTTGTLEPEAATALRLATEGLLGGQVSFGAFGLVCAWGLKRRERFAWRLGVLWGALAIVHAITTATSEVLMAKWSTVCLSTIEFAILGVIALGCLLAVRKKFV